MWAAARLLAAQPLREHTMTTPDHELQPLDHEAVAASYKGFTRVAAPDRARYETAAAYNARRDAQEAACKVLPGMLPGVLQAAAWLLVLAAILTGFVLWPRGYDASEAQMVVAISYAAAGLVTALLIAAAGRIVELLEVIAARGS